MSEKKLRAVVIGNSKYAFNAHIPFLRNSKDVELLGIATSRIYETSDEIKIPIIGKEKAFGNYNAMLQEIKPDVAIISSAPGTHYEQIMASLHNGAHVLVDKAMVCSSQQAEEVVELADSKNLLLGVAVQRRYDKSTIYMREMVNNGDIGEITLTSGFYCRWFPPFADTWRNIPEAAWGGITADSGYHLIDTILWILGSKPISVHAELLSVNLDVEDISSLNVRLEDNSILNIVSSYVPPQHFIREEVSIYGKKGALLFSRNEDFTGPLHSNLVYLNEKGEPQEVPLLETKSDRESPVRNFINSILGREQLLATGFNSMVTTKLIEAAYCSAHLNQVVKIS